MRKTKQPTAIIRKRLLISKMLMAQAVCELHFIFIYNFYLIKQWKQTAKFAIDNDTVSYWNAMLQVYMFWLFYKISFVL